MVLEIPLALQMRGTAMVESELDDHGLTNGAQPFPTHGTDSSLLNRRGENSFCRLCERYLLLKVDHIEFDCQAVAPIAEVTG